MNNYTDLVNEIIAWTDRTDISSKISNFVQLAEVRISQDLTTQDLENVYTFSTVAGQSSYALPSDFQSIVRAWLEKDTGGHELKNYNPSLTSFDTIQSIPVYCYIEDANFTLKPTPISVYTVKIAYKSQVTSLASNSTNSVMTKYPNIYLFAALVEAFSYLKNPEAANLYDGRYRKAVADANRKDNAKRNVLLATDAPALSNKFSDTLRRIV